MINTTWAKLAGGATFAVVLSQTSAGAAVLTVGPHDTYKTIAAAVAASADGDTIDVQAGTYTNDFAEIGKKITLQAIGGRVQMHATQSLPNQKGILITDTDTTIIGFTFSGARVPQSAGQNGAGIRYQGGRLLLERCYFHDNQDGMLADGVPGGTVTIRDSEFAHNGDASGPGSGHTHNLYVNGVDLLDIESSYFHNAVVGHEIKSRALKTIINGTRVVDGPTGTASYSVDLPNGGVATISNSQIEQGPLTQNPIIINFGEEGNLNANSALTLQTSLIENDLASSSALAVANQVPAPAIIAANQVFGLVASQMFSGAARESGTTYLTTEPVISTAHPF